MSLEEVDGVKSAAVEPPQSTKICRIHLERGTTESRYEKEMGHGYQMIPMDINAHLQQCQPVLMFALWAKKSTKNT